MSGFQGPRPRAIGRIHWMGARTLFRRELGRYLKEALETVLAPAFQTLVYFIVLVFALGPERGTEEGDALLSFAVPGLILMAVLFRSASGALRHDTRDAGGLRAAYLVRLAERRAALTRAAATAGWHFGTHDTAAPPAQALLWLWSVLEG